MFLKIKSLLLGIRIGIQCLYEEVFKKRIPIQIVWIIGILSIPINIIYSRCLYFLNKKSYDELKQSISDIIEKSDSSQKILIEEFKRIEERIEAE